MKTHKGLSLKIFLETLSTTTRVRELSGDYHHPEIAAITKLLVGSDSHLWKGLS